MSSVAAEQGIRLQAQPAFVFGGQNGPRNSPPVSPGAPGAWPGGPGSGDPPQQHPASYGHFAQGPQAALPLQLPMVRRRPCADYMAVLEYASFSLITRPFRRPEELCSNAFAGCYLTIISQPVTVMAMTITIE